MTQAVEVLERVRKRVQDGQLVRRVWTCSDGRACLHAMLQEEIAVTSRTGMPTKLNGEVFWAVWLSLPEWADRSIPAFIDAGGTSDEDAIRVIDAAIERLQSVAVPSGTEEP